MKRKEILNICGQGNWIYFLDEKNCAYYLQYPLLICLLNVLDFTKLSYISIFKCVYYEEIIFYISEIKKYLIILIVQIKIQLGKLL